jgi:hypothetical protein
MPQAVAAPLNNAGSPRRWIPVALVVLGLLLTVVALPDAANRERLSYAYIIGFAFLWSVVLGSLFFVGLQHLTSAIWSVAIRRVAEMLAAPMWILAPLVLPLLAFAIWPEAFPVFPWADAALVEGDHLLSQKTAYLNVPFFVARAAVFVLIWIAFTRYFVGKSLKQDRGEGGAEATLSMRKVSAPFTLIFAATATLAGFDWLMSLSPKWFSTMFGVYVFSGMVCSALAAICIGTVVLRKAGLLGQGLVGADHLYNLGGLLFAFVCFWGYIAFSQYMLIWYANVPEESFYFVKRLEGGWLPVSVTLGLVRFVIPFLALLPRRAKMNVRTLFWVSILVLGGQLLDLYWIVAPELHESRPVLGWQELGPSLLMVGLALGYYARFLRRHSALAVGDPLLEESRQMEL